MALRQAEISAHLDLSTRALRDLFARGDLPKGGTLDEIRTAYIRKLRAAASGREPTGELDPAQEKAALDLARRTEIEDRIRVKRGELMPRDEYCRDLAAVLKLLAVTLESLPDVLERDAGIDGGAVERCRQVIDGLREELYVRLRDLETPTE